MLNIKHCAITIIVCLSFNFSKANYIEILRDAETEIFLKNFTKRILKSSEPALGLVNNTNFLIVNDKSINAFVTPINKVIFIHSGLILASKNSDTLFGVIAHETGHLNNYHYVRSLNLEKEQNQLTKILISLGTIMINPMLGLGGLTVTIADSQEKMIKYSQQNEEEADRHALKVMKENNISLKGHANLMSYFDKLSKETGISEKVLEYLSSHPLPKKRLEKLQRFEIENQCVVCEQRNLELEDQFNRIRYKLSGYLNQTTTLNDPMDIRLENKRKFYELIFAAYNSLSQKKYQEALKYSNMLINQEPNNSYFYELRAEIHKFIDRKKAINDIKYAIKLNPKECLFRVNLGNLAFLNKETDLLKKIKESLKICQINDQITNYNSILHQIATLEKDEISILYYQGLIFIKQNHKKEALKKLEQALTLAKEQKSNMVYNIEDILFELKKK
jgi:predicted Zn-dependent protease